MTEEFKNKLLKYLTGNLGERTGINFPIFERTETIENNLNTYIWDNFGIAGRPDIIDIIKSVVNDNYLCYGVGRDYDGNNKVYFFGFIIILNRNFEIIYSTRKYSSGTEMTSFTRLNQNENGSFYGIDHDYKTGTSRFIMLNNMLIKKDDEASYEVKLRKTYNITANYPSSMSVIGITKNPNAANYFIYGYRTVNSYNRPCCIEYTINVGTANEWVQYDYTSADAFNYGVTGGWASWDSENNLTFRLIGGKSGTNNKEVRVYKNSSTIIALDNTYTIPIDTSDFQAGDGITFTSVILNDNKAYVLAFVYGSVNYGNIYRIKNNEIIGIHFDAPYSGYLGNLVTISLKTDYINTYFTYLVPELGNYAFIGGIITDDGVGSVNIINTANVTQNSIMNGFNQFNLHNLVIQSGDYLYKKPFIYNQYIYTGMPYENVNSLVPSNVVLYDNNVTPRPIFARSLYNKLVNNNTTVSTVEIPNTFLNDVTIKNKILKGETNINLNLDTSQITKNIYETLDINFFNTLTMKNSNDPDNEIINTIGATRINTSVSEETDYDDAKCCKVRINYEDNTTKVNTISWYPVGNYYRVNVLVYVNKAIHSIDFISNDETTVYNTINPTLDVNKYYVIKQDVYIDNKIEPDTLYYGDDELYYNDEPIYY